MGRAWQRAAASASGSGDFTYEPGTSTVGLTQIPPTLAGTNAVLRTIITGRLTVIPDMVTPHLVAGWQGRCEARLVLDLAVPGQPWPSAVDIANSEILGRTVMNVTVVPPSTESPEGAGIWETTGEIDLHGMRDFSKYPSTPNLRLGGNWASEDLGSLTGNTFTWTWFGTVSVLWGLAG